MHKKTESLLYAITYIHTYADEYGRGEKRRGKGKGAKAKKQPF